MKKFIIIFVLLFLVLTPHSQHITNTIGTGGTFSIKDNGTIYLSLSQSDGLINLSNGIKLLNTSSSGTGVIFKGSSSFIHNYNPPGQSIHNTFVGIDAGNFTMTSGNDNTGVGYLSLRSLTTGYNNSAYGTFSLSNNTLGFGNSAFGAGVLFSNTSGNDNSGFGTVSLYNNTTGDNNSAFGYLSMRINTTGSDNSAFGYSSLLNNSTGNNNSVFGSNSMISNTTGFSNSAFGTFSLNQNTTGLFNTAIGVSSLQFNTTGFKNVAIGSFSQLNSTTADNNTSVGSSSLYTNSTGYSNVAVGTNTLLVNTTGAGNTSIGAFSMNGNTTGQLNTVIGYQSGSNIISGSNVTLVGYNTEPSSSSVSNQITLGNNSVTSLRCNVTTITSLSDARDKKNIHDLSLGLDFISKLKPRIYNWDKREWYDNNVSDGSKMQEAPTAGFIAQELDEVQTSENAEWLNLVLKDNPEKWEATPGNLLPVMVKAIQELNEKCDSLQKENSKLTAKFNEVNDLKEKLALLSAQIENLNIKTDELKRSSGNDKNTGNNTQVISNENTK